MENAKRQLVDEFVSRFVKRRINLFFFPDLAITSGSSVAYHILKLLDTFEKRHSTRASSR
jgi:hypothetical protein